MHILGLRRTVVLLYLMPLAGLALPSPAEAAGVLKVMLQGLGAGTVGSGANGIDCGSNCDQIFLTSQAVNLKVTASPGSVFVGWHGDCESAGTATACTVNMTSDRLVRAEFQLNPDVPVLPMNPTVADIQNFLTANPSVTSAAGFLRALDPAYKRGWILMTRSESLQTGTARFPRILMPSMDARTVFTFALAEHASYPGTSPKAVEMLQYDSADRNFHFHEIVLDHIDAVTQVVPVSPDAPTGVYEIFPARNRGMSVDEPRCTRCHSTRNIPNPNPADRGTSVPGVPAFNKPNWDPYDNWGGVMPFNEDRIYQGSLEAAAFRKLLNPWSFRANPPARQIIEQLELQPPGVNSVDQMTRVSGGARDATPLFSFDWGVPPATEPAPAGSSPPVNVNYSFDNVDSSAPGSPVQRGGNYSKLREAWMPPYGSGRAFELFNRLGGTDSLFNSARIGTEVAGQRFATGGVPIDVRPVTLAIARGCLVVNNAMNRVESTTSTPLTVDQTFFRDRHRIVSSGMGINELIYDTYNRQAHMPVRKVNIQKLNLDRAGDVYIKDPSDEGVDLISEYGSTTSQGVSTAIERLRQEIFRRPIDTGHPDLTPELEGHFVDREFEAQDGPSVALFRFFLEPLGVPVDRWSKSVRGRSRTYTFSDVFSPYKGEIAHRVEDSLNTPGDGYPGLTTLDCEHLIPAVNSSLSSLPTLVPPTYTDVQRVFNKGCIECHGGLGYPPFTKFLYVTDLNLAEEENPPTHDRLQHSFENALRYTSNALDTTNVLWTRITASGENCGDFVSMMPCGGPPLTGPDIDTIARWIQGGTPNTRGDPHIHTIDGTDYDFQSAGEFTLLRGEEMEIQARQTPVQTAAPLPADAHTGLSSCPSINTAAAIRVGTHRITYEPNISGQPDPSGMQLRIDGRLVEMGARGAILSGGGRILPTPTPGGIQIEYPGGTDIVLTPNWWPNYQLWYLDIDVRHSRGNFGVMGVIAPKNWLPALPDNSWLGAEPSALLDRYNQVYGKFADAWRVTNATTLFDYAAGTSTASFTLQGWPAFEPRDCKLPAGWAQKAPPQTPIQIEAARKICSAVIDKKDLEKCAQDVAATGETGFANLYAGGEKIQRNNAPTQPALTYPRNLDAGFPDTVDFSWSPASDRDGGRLTYLHCVWRIGEQLDYGKHCKEMPAQSYSTTVSGLTANTMYYWKVVVDDAQGGIVSSEVRRFHTR